MKFFQFPSADKSKRFEIQVLSWKNQSVGRIQKVFIKED